MEANTRVLQATPHSCDPSNNGHYEQCDRDGCTQNTRDLANSYGQGAGFTIDTTYPFTVSTTFLSQGGTVSGMRTSLEQDDKEVILDHASCDFEYMGRLTEALSQGMTLRITYWGDSAQTMSWLDTPPCGAETCSGGNAGEATISEIAVRDALTSEVPLSHEDEIRFLHSPHEKAAAVRHAIKANPQNQEGDSCTAAFKQCGGERWSGRRTCCQGHVCNFINKWYSQCEPDGKAPAPAPDKAAAPASKARVPGPESPWGLVKAPRAQEDGPRLAGARAALPEAPRFDGSGPDGSPPQGVEDQMKVLVLPAALACMLMLLVPWAATVLTLWCFPWLAPADVTRSGRTERDLRIWSNLPTDETMPRVVSPRSSRIAGSRAACWLGGGQSVPPTRASAVRGEGCCEGGLSGLLEAVQVVNRLVQSRLTPLLCPLAAEKGNAF
jgi:hypothetical protein